jgi:hypothetical protein
MSTMQAIRAIFLPNIRMIRVLILRANSWLVVFETNKDKATLFTEMTESYLV